MKEGPAPPDVALSPRDLWHCGNGHLSSQRVMRIIERNTATAWTVETIDALEELARLCGPVDCEEALQDDIPF